MKRWSGAKLDGFTAIELIIVIAIAAIIMAIAIPVYNNFSENNKISTNLSQIEADLRNAKQKATASGTTYQVSYTTNATYYSITGKGNVLLNSGVQIHSDSKGSPISLYPAYEASKKQTSSGTIVIYLGSKRGSVVISENGKINEGP